MTRAGRGVVGILASFDDVIAALTAAARQAGDRVLIASADKDLLQLVDDQVAFWDLGRNERVTPEGVHERFGVWPEQMVDYLTLIGDSSDSIPGVPGVGPKTAARWLEAHGTLEALLEAAPTLTGKTAAALIEHAPQLEAMRELIRLDDRCLPGVAIDHLIPDAPLESRLRDFMMEHGIAASVIDTIRLPGAAEETPAPSP